MKLSALLLFIAFCPPAFAAKTNYGDEPTVAETRDMVVNDAISESTNPARVGKTVVLNDPPFFSTPERVRGGWWFLAIVGTCALLSGPMKWLIDRRKKPAIVADSKIISENTIK